MNDTQLTSYAAIESRLPVGFPRLWATPHWISKCGGEWCVGSGTECGPRMSDLERLGFSVLVLRAAFASGVLDPVMAEYAEAMLVRGFAHKEGDIVDYINALLTALESAYPEGSQP